MRAVNIYKSRDVGMSTSLFRADSFDELITQIDMMSRIGNSDVDTVQAIAAYRRDIKDRRVKLEADKAGATRSSQAAPPRRPARRACEADLESMTAGLKTADQDACRPRRRLRAKLAPRSATAASSADVDPNSPGHPEIVAMAQRYFGVPYVWGGASPSGFDCSGLTMYCYAQIGIKMSHGATDQQRASIPVPLSDLRPGDLVFFGNASFSHHVAIYVGGGSVHRSAAHRRRGALRLAGRARRLDRRPFLSLQRSGAHAVNAAEGKVLASSAEATRVTRQRDPGVAT